MCEDTVVGKGLMWSQKDEVWCCYQVGVLRTRREKRDKSSHERALNCVKKLGRLIQMQDRIINYLRSFKKL